MGADAVRAARRFYKMIFAIRRRFDDEAKPLTAAAASTDPDTTAALAEGPAAH